MRQIARGTRIGGHRLGQSQARADAFDQPADMPDQIGRKAGQRRGRVWRDKAPTHHPLSVAGAAQ